MKIEEPSQIVLDRIPGRVLTFLKAVGTTIPIRAILASNGYTQEDHEEGWTLLHKVSGYTTSNPPSSDTDVMDAVAYLDKWDEKGIRRVKTVLKRHHPDQYLFVCTDLEPGKGPDSVLAVARLLNRIEALESSPEREATREADHQALATLANRKLDNELWAMLKGLVDTVQNPSIEEEPPIDEGATDAHYQALLDLYGWFQEWSELARDEIPRRDYLIRLGLAQRKNRAQIITGDSADDITPIEDPTEVQPPS